MRNFIAFIKHFQVYLIFALLQGVAFSLYFSFNQFPKTQYFTTASAVQGTMLTYRNDLTKHFNLSDNNLRLQKENIELLQKNPMSFVSMENGLVKINDTLNQTQFEYIPATILNSTYDKRDNYFTINIGSSQGVERGMGVFTMNGVVGIIHNTSEHFSVIKSCLTKKLNISIMLEGTGEFGFLEWDGTNARHGSLTGISNDLLVEKGTKIVTRGGDKVFPRGITVGVVDKVSTIEGKPLWDIDFVFGEDFRKIQNVYVIKNLLLEEQENLENQVVE